MENGAIGQIGETAFVSQQRTLQQGIDKGTEPVLTLFAMVQTAQEIVQQSWTALIAAVSTVVLIKRGGLNTGPQGDNTKYLDRIKVQFL